MFCFCCYISRMHYELLHWSASWKTSHTISLHIFFPVSMVELLDLLGFGFARFWNFSARYSLSLRQTVMEHGCEWHFSFASPLHNHNPTAFSSDSFLDVFYLDDGCQQHWLHCLEVECTETVNYSNCASSVRSLAWWGTPQVWQQSWSSVDCLAHQC
jgi:hypothetical protein